MSAAKRAAITRCIGVDVGGLRALGISPRESCLKVPEMGTGEVRVASKLDRHDFTHHDAEI